MSPNALLTALQNHNWMALIALFSLLVRTWLSEKSSFPLTLPPNWRPVVTAIATGVMNAIASAQAGVAWPVVIATSLVWAASTGLLDGVLAAMYGDPTKAPKWARFIVMIFDTVETGGGGGGKAPPVDPPKPPEVVVAPGPTVVVPPATPMTALMFIGVALALVFVGATLMTTDCAPATGLPSTDALAQYWADQSVCVDDASTRAEADYCRAIVRVKWCAAYPAAEDCHLDAGGVE